MENKRFLWLWWRRHARKGEFEKKVEKCARRDGFFERKWRGTQGAWLWEKAVRCARSVALGKGGDGCKECRFWRKWYKVAKKSAKIAESEAKVGVLCRKTSKISSEVEIVAFIDIKAQYSKILHIKDFNKIY